ncbi:MAG: hypothetical protein IPM54_41995 [Polyangiaceae bacterium]|nr:hypothetical protein [Polyangiaceae bacterium]
MKKHSSIMLGMLVLGFAGAGMTGACGSDAPVPVNGIECPVSMDDLSVGMAAATDACPTECSAEVEKPCKRFKIQLQGDPNNNIETRRKYKAAFGSACYMSADINNSTFNCFYRKVEGKGQACEHAQMVAQVFGAAPYAEGYPCKEVPGTKIDLVHRLVDAPLQHPLIEVDAVPTIAVNGPYRNLPEPQDLAPGNDFYKEVVDKNGNQVDQQDLILKVNRDANGGEIHSDLAGFVYPCDKTDPSKMCTEPTVLKKRVLMTTTPRRSIMSRAPKTTRCCPWGTNSNANAAVISRKLNHFLRNKYPSAARGPADQPGYTLPTVRHQVTCCPGAH